VEGDVEVVGEEGEVIEEEEGAEVGEEEEEEALEGEGEVEEEEGLVEEGEEEEEDLEVVGEEEEEVIQDNLGCVKVVDKCNIMSDFLTILKSCASYFIHMLCVMYPDYPVSCVIV
jgi:Cobalamin biosynthesis protein CobT (nicotinate-mononucleotide:5, 6-dimethylbenzimidazole phosphoribosyltransferase)